MISRGEVLRSVYSATCGQLQAGSALRDVLRAALRAPSPPKTHVAALTAAGRSGARARTVERWF